jgi:peptide-methionine (R)-S-oxide reductase
MNTLSKISLFSVPILLLGFVYCSDLSNQNSNATIDKETKTSQIEITMDTSKPHQYFSLTDTIKLTLSDAVWKNILPEDVYYIARKKGTEYAFSGKFWDFEGIGEYHCAACGNHLFTSDAKFGSSCGWPSFYKPGRESAMNYISDYSHGMNRVEVTCGRCDGHLGHIFDDGPAPTGKRYCMNSLMLHFVQKK